MDALLNQSNKGSCSNGIDGAKSAANTKTTTSCELDGDGVDSNGWYCSNKVEGLDTK